MRFLLFLALLAPPLAAQNEDGSGLPHTELSEFERLGQLPDWLAPDYKADIAAAGVRAAEVAARYRRILMAVSKMSEAEKAAFAAKGSAAETRVERNDVVGAYTGVSTNVPIKSFSLGNDNASFSAALPPWHPTPNLALGSDLKLGVLAPLGATGDQNSTLRQSPYVFLALSGAYDGAVKAFLMATGSLSALRSEKIIIDPQGKYASVASGNPGGARTTQTFGLVSAYGDFGTVAKFGDSLRAAFYVAGEGLVYSHTAPSEDDRNPAMPMVSVGAGTIWMVKNAVWQATAFTDLRLQGVLADTRRYRDLTVSPSLTNGVELARLLGRTSRVAGGLEGSISVEDAAVRPYLSARTGDVSALVAGDLRKSRGDFFPDVIGGGASVGWQALPFMTLGVQGSVAQKAFPMAPAPYMDYTAMTMLNFDLDHGIKFRSTLRAPQRYGGERNVMADADALKRFVPGPAYDLDFKAALLASPTLGDFGRRIGARSEDSILSALSALSYNLNQWNYNVETAGWAGTDEEIYAKARDSILKGQKNPAVQCQGGATFIAALAVELGKQAGVPIQAAMTGVEVPSANGAQNDHAVAAVKTRSYGIVFVDWGQLTPTYTYDTRRALDVFQGLQGIPAVTHYLADSAGRFGGYLFSLDGKVMVENLSYHAELPSSPLHQVFRDDPEAASIAVERYKKMLEKAP